MGVKNGDDARTGDKQMYKNENAKLYKNTNSKKLYIYIYIYILYV